MSEANNSSSESEANGFFSKLINGDFGLAKTYWLYGVLVGVVINVIVRVIPSLEILALVIALALAYQAVVLVGVWRAANKYRGRKTWIILAKIATVLGWFGIVSGVGALVDLSGYL